VLRFDGRISEDFKLSSGIKVRSGVLRAQIMSHIPHLADDIVLGGEGRDGLVALVFARGQATLEQIAGALAGWNRANPGSSTAITRVALADFVPDARSGEVSAKGQIVQSRVLKNRATLFAALSDGESGLAP
jgi:feruloyl-CoA synthase